MFSLSPEKLFLRNYSVFYHYCSTISRILPSFSVNILIPTNDGIRKDRFQLLKIITTASLCVLLIYFSTLRTFCTFSDSLISHIAYGIGKYYYWLLSKVGKGPKEEILKFVCDSKAIFCWMIQRWRFLLLFRLFVFEDTRPHCKRWNLLYGVEWLALLF